MICLLPIHLIEITVIVFLLGILGGLLIAILRGWHK